MYPAAGTSCVERNAVRYVIILLLFYGLCYRVVA